MCNQDTDLILKWPNVYRVILYKKLYQFEVIHGEQKRSIDVPVFTQQNI